jgi:hypothetical protein
VRQQSGQDQAHLCSRIAQIVDEHHAKMRQVITMHERAQIVVLRQENPSAGLRFREERSVPRVFGSFGSINHVVPGRTHGPDCVRHNVCIRKHAHLFGRDRQTFRRSFFA